MELGIVFGLVAAVCWGASDIFARGASRTAGTFRALLVVQFIALPAMLIGGFAFGFLHLATLNADPQAIITAIGIGLVILGGAGLLYHGFAVGNIAIVSPIAASYSAITAILAITLSGEQPSILQLAGIVVTLGGVILTSLVPGRPLPDTAERPRTGPFGLAPGLLEALLSLFIFGAAYWAMRFPVDQIGGYAVVFAQKVGDFTVMTLLALILGLRWLLRRRKHRTAVANTSTIPIPALSVPAVVIATPANAPARPALQALLFTAYVIPMALFDTAANIAYTLGITVSLTSIVAVLSSLFSPITVLLAWIFLRERLYRWQWLGVLAIFIGVALVSL